MRILTATALIVVMALPATAHTSSEINDWNTDWRTRVIDQGGLTPGLLAEYQDFIDRHTPTRYRITTTSRTFIPAVEKWRSLVEVHFGPYTDQALSVMQCESRGNAQAQNPTSTASGLFQFLGSTWKRVTGLDNHNGVFDGALNIEAAAKLSEGGTNWREWSCRP